MVVKLVLIIIVVALLNLVELSPLAARLNLLVQKSVDLIMQVIVVLKLNFFGNLVALNFVLV